MVPKAHLGGFEGGMGGLGGFGLESVVAMGRHLLFLFARLVFSLQHKILLPSAVHLEERLTVSQSVPEPASRQSDRYTQFGFFVSGRCGTKQQGGPASQYK